jgi:hypothetical protein
MPSSKGVNRKDYAAGGSQRSVVLDDALWADIQQSARMESVTTGENVSASEWVRRAACERLERLARSKR